MRLNQLVAHATGLSRRQADDAIAAGKVIVNNKVGRLGQSVTDEDEVVMDDKKLTVGPYVYYVFNKPEGIVSTRNSESGDKTIYDLLPPELYKLRIVGRLDKDSSGLIILTNDGQYALELTHPKFQTEKVYEIVLDKSLSEADRKALEKGVELPEGLSKIEVEGEGRSLKVILREGKNRQIRRTFGLLGYTVIEIARIKHGPYELGDLKTGEFKEVSKIEL